jgi:hypothetical protein
MSTAKQDTANFNQLLTGGKYLLLVKQGYIYLGKKMNFGLCKRKYCGFLLQPRVDKIWGKVNTIIMVLFRRKLHY